ncbi:xylulokinase [Gryllotalpicola ginsengisoli]|uniref:xylulokinase n=1 Tax=Gryllotalpicola ginsengisoli TaxID=444608 RepID=UPI0003B61929|nr:FGGY-family carbohydrate kinase [Gryllotalpicola ginsengisoli]
MATEAAEVIASGQAVLGIELGSTRIKASLIGPDFTPLADGSHEWQNEYVDGRWTYPLKAVWSGLQACYADLAANAEREHGVRPASFRAIGVSAMMHGYLAFDERGELLVPFRTWRNTSTGPAAAELTEALGFNVPLRWSIAHLYQAVLDGEEHVQRLASLETLAVHVHRRLTGRFVAGVGDASGMFPIDPATGDYDQGKLETAERLVGRRAPGLSLRGLLPEVLPAGAQAGELTAEGAALLDPRGELRPGIPFCPPEGDAGTGMVATNAVAPRTGNVSVGTSVFAMVVLEQPLAAIHPEIDVVTTPAGDPVAMVHCNNGASELAAWAGVFTRFAETIGAGADGDTVYRALLDEALAGDADGGGLLAYNYLSGEPVAGLEEGRPLVVRTPDSSFTLANLMRTQLYAVFATLALGMRVLDGEGVRVDRLVGHGGIFRTAGVAQRLLAAALEVPVAVERTAGEGGSWGMALLAAYLEAAPEQSLAEFLGARVFRGDAQSVVDPDPADVAGFTAFLERFTAGLDIERAAAGALQTSEKGQA